MKNKHYYSEKMAIGLIRFFASLRFAQNDNYLGMMGEGGGSGKATSTSLTHQNVITRCHSESRIFRDEESLNFSRTALKNKFQFILLLLLACLTFMLSNRQILNTLALSTFN